MEGHERAASSNDMAYIAAANPATILKLLAELEQAKADAARYRWLKHHCYDTEPAGESDAFDFPSLHFEDQDLEPWDSDSLDLVIDAAIQSQEVKS